MNKYILNASLVAIGFFAGYLLFSPAGGGSHENMQMSDGSVEMSMEADMDMQMNPDPIEVGADLPVPAVEIVDSFKGMMGEYTFQVVMDNFTIDPISVDSDPVPNEGHGHVFVNDVRAGRVYGEWVYVPGSYFSPGRNKVTVSLNANNHAFWTINDSPIQDTIFIEY